MGDTRVSTRGRGRGVLWAGTSSVIFAGRNKHEARWLDSGLARVRYFSGSGHRGRPWSSGTWPWVRRAGE